jgi:very-short-patch-repair endonuclease
MTAVDDPEDQRWLHGVYNQLREKLLDLTKRNRMLSYNLSARSKKHLQIVDEVLEEVYNKLLDPNVSLRIDPLEEPHDIPPEERNKEFVAALDHAKLSDFEYLTQLGALENIGRDGDEFEVIKLERQLRDRVRTKLGLPPRPKKGEINPAEQARLKGVDPNYELKPTKTKPSHTDSILQTLKFPGELERIMDKLIDDARLAEQEMGISTLFLAFGFLEWYDSDSSDKKLFAPLLLSPIRIERKKPNGKPIYTIAATEETVEVNLSLQKLLEKNYGRKLPTLEGADEESTISIESYLEAVRNTIKGLSRWQVHRWLVLGHFAFGRMAMYSDLHPENWPGGPLENPIIKSILRGTDDSKGEPTFPSEQDDYPIDDPKIEVIAPVVIQDADASQHSALVDVMKGNNLVIQGPPGTGKSQTISNIIAAALAANKTVLFVAEKQAALDVVKRKLEKCGLGEFCLELHSDKAAPKFVIESLKQRGAVKSVFAPVINDATWQENRKELSGYINALHAKHDDGQTPFDLIWAALRGKTTYGAALEPFKSIKLPHHVIANPAQAAAAQDQIDLFAATYKSFSASFGHPVDSPWYLVSLDRIAGHQTGELIDKLREAQEIVRELLECISANSNVGIASFNDLPTIVSVDAALGQPTASELLEKIADLNEGDLTKALLLRRELHEISDALRTYGGVADHEPPAFVNAAKVVDLGLPERFLEMSPDALAQIAKDTIGRISTLTTAVQNFRPALEIFAVDDSYPMNELDILATAAMVCEQIPIRYHAPMRSHLAINEQAFSDLHSIWSTLSATELEWRTKLAAYGQHPWPQSSAIREAAATLNKKGLSKAWAGLGGSIKTARQVLTRIGFEDDNICSGDVERLAAHLDALKAFETDQAAAGLLGASWHGLTTAFDEIGNGIKVRKILAETIGLATLLKLIGVSLASVPALNLHAAAGKELHNALRDFDDLVDDRPIRLMLDMRAREIQTMKRVLGLVGQWSLPDVKLSIREIAQVAKLQLRARELAIALAGSRLRHAAEDLGKSIADIDRAVEALRWLKSVRAIRMPPALLRRLTGFTAAEERARLRGQAKRIAGLLGTYKDLMKVLSVDFGLADCVKLDLQKLLSLSGTLVERSDQLPDFLALAARRKALSDLGFREFITRADQCRLDPDGLSGILAAFIASHRADIARRTSPEIAKNNGSTLDALRKQFAEKDRARIEASRIAVKGKLLKRVPLPGSNSGKRKTWTEMALISNEMGKQKGFVPVRSLLSRAGASIVELKPCFMMSPLSLAKFLKPGQLKFDLLVIDEASQMRPEDALGAAHRCDQIVVVGDPKQLPPTNFFNRSMDEETEEESDNLEDESILDSCYKAFGQRRALKWHYRSQCESLIRFSNENFYRRELITFPAAKPGSFSIDLVRVNGTYQGRCNPVEASRIAEQAVLFMRRHADLGEATIPSLGIVAVNTEQRDLIQEELRRIMADDPKVEAYREKVEGRGEELFVKNLENVQGDERDFIFISMTYGFEPGATAMKQRFGPINSKQGHRRLNVLFSRARMRIGLFTSFGSVDIVPTETSAEGVHILRKYLEYAEVRGRADVVGSGAQPDSDFEVEVAERLRARSYVVDYQVGVSGYKIDLGVRHPDFPEQYLVGVECDGAAYHSSKSARDRDRIREEVLQSKGWNLIRVWSTDWFENADVQTTRLIHKIEEIRKKAHFDRRDYPPLTPSVSDQHNGANGAQKSKRATPEASVSHSGGGGAIVAAEAAE